MRRSARALFVGLILLLAACGGSNGDGEVRVAIIEGARRAVVTAEVASTPDQRATGLMGRREIPEARGMLFVFPSPTRGGFWMKNTLVPLRIFFIRAGTVVDVREMQPCTADPCPLTIPDEPYDRALEVPLTALAGFGPGARVEVEGRVPQPV
ncbi:MAG TPA: DUF192 domain-containing protein [Actinomycetota bacterium]|nr:DUF192 domain-containing protein [Actinomycetota bacterium]